MQKIGTQKESKTPLAVDSRNLRKVCLTEISKEEVREQSVGNACECVVQKGSPLHLETYFRERRV